MKPPIEQTEQHLITAAFIECHWPVSNVQNVQILQKRGERKVYKAESDQGTFVYKIADPSKGGSEVVERDTLSLQFLGQVGFPAPRLLPTKDGTRSYAEDGKNIYAFEFIEGKEPPPTVETYEQIGKLVARLHSIREPFPHDTEYTPEKVVQTMFARAERNKLDPKYAELIHTIPSFEGLPKVMIHTDVGLPNIIQRPSGEMVLIDWDDAGIGYPVLDVGWITLCFMRDDLTYEADKAVAFLNAYNSVRPLTEQEKEYIYWGGFMICLDYAFEEDGTQGKWSKVQYLATQQKMFDEALSKLSSK